MGLAHAEGAKAQKRNRSQESGARIQEARSEKYAEARPFL